MRSSRSMRYAILLRLAQAAKIWENLWARFWPAACLIGTFVAVVLLDVLPLLPAWLHVLALVLFAVALIVAFVYASPGLKPVSHTVARKRIERDSELPHQPLSAMEDSLAAGRGNPVAEALWARHQMNAARHADAVTLALPHTDLSRYEPWGIRAAVLLAVSAGLFIGGADPRTRLERALLPGWTFDGSRPVTVEVWVTPPEYTRQAPLFLQHPPPQSEARVPDSQTDVIPVPAGSRLAARVTGTGSPPTLQLGDRSVPFDVMESGLAAHSVETEITAGDHIAVDASGDTIAEWRMEVVSDTPPGVTFSGPIGSEGNGLLRIAFEAEDDYGIDFVDAIIVSEDQQRAGEPYRFSLPLSTTSPLTVAGSAVRDLTPHEWAGTPVVMHIEATDVAGQLGRSAAVTTILPERHFSHPIARLIIAERKRLFGDVAAATRRDVAATLDGIARQPEFYANALVVSLALSVSKSRLLYDGTDTGLASVRSILWDTALRLDEGDVPFAERRLNQARQELWEALRGNTDIAEIERLIDELQRALNEYLAAVAAELARRDQMATPQQMPSEAVRSEDLQRLIEMARQLARSGARDGARQLLSELKNMLDGIRQGLESGNTNQEMRQAQRLLDGLKDLAERQERLLDQTFQQLRDMRGAQTGSQDTPSLETSRDQAEAQQELRRALGDLMLDFDQFMGGIPGPLGDAERAMAGAEQALNQGRLGVAVPQQGAAVQALEGAREAASQALAQRLGGLFGMMGSGEDGEGDASDIFGRAPADGQRGFGVGEVAIPDEIEIQRAQEIIQELRDRASDRRRPPEELHYIERLLRMY